jgi:hypothetical protein
MKGELVDSYFDIRGLTMPSFLKSIRLSPEGNSVLYISAIIIVVLFIDLLFTTFPFYNYRTQSSPYTLFFFASQILIFGLFQFLYLNLVRRMAPHGKSSESHRSYLHYIDKLIPVAQIILMIILSYTVAEVVFLHAYHTIFISIVVWISCIAAVVLLGMLIFRFVQWFKTSNDKLILSYAFALGLIILNCGIILAYINTTLESRPKVIPSTYASVNYGITVQFPLNNAYRATSFASFIAIWAASIFSLIGYSKKIGRIKFCLAVSLPILYFLSQSEFFLGPFILSHRFLDPVTFFRIYTISFASTRLIGGIMFAIPYFLVSRKIDDPRVRNYLKLTSIGVILLFLSIQVSSLPILPYPPFGVISISFLGLSSYLILVGIYSSAISVSEDSMLRKSVRKLIVKETKLLDSIATAQMEQEIQNKVLEATKRLSATLSKETGIESSLHEEDIKRYCKEVLAEIKRK